MHLQYKGELLLFERLPGESTWTILAEEAPSDFHSMIPSTSGHLTFDICADGLHSFARTAKLHSKFRSDLLWSMLEAERVSCNMVLFHCTICNNRFPTFHPKHHPKIKLQCLATCPIEVDTWEDPTEDAIPENALMAPYCRGRCLRCAKQMPTEPQATDTMLLRMQVPIFGRESSRSSFRIPWPPCWLAASRSQ